jgi:hypothetical protein
MTRAQTTKTVGALLLLMTGLVVFTEYGTTFYASIAAPYPPAWSKLQPGMTSDEARALLGRPTSDGRGLKASDRWLQIQGGVEIYLDLYLDHNVDGTGVVKSIVRWKHWRHFPGKNFDKQVEPP